VIDYTDYSFTEISSSVIQQSITHFRNKRSYVARLQIGSGIICRSIFVVACISCINRWHKLRVVYMDRVYIYGLSLPIYIGPQILVCKWPQNFLNGL